MLLRSIKPVYVVDVSNMNAFVIANGAGINFLNVNAAMIPHENLY